MSGSFASFFRRTGSAAPRARKNILIRCTSLRNNTVDGCLNPVRLGEAGLKFPVWTKDTGAQRVGLLHSDAPTRGGYLHVDHHAFMRAERKRIFLSRRLKAMK
jgi:hypothetical protein